VRLVGGVFLDAEFTSPWCVTSKVGPEDCRPFMTDPAHLIAYHYVIAGRLLLEADGNPPVEVQAGEIVLLPRNDSHRLGSTLDLTPVEAETLIQPPGDSGMAHIAYGGGGERTRIVCGFLGSDSRQDPLLATLPAVLKLNVREGAAGDWIESSFRFAAGELAAEGVGSAAVLSKLSELLFVEAVRHYVATLPPEGKGWLSGLRDPYVGRALALMHARPVHSWTAQTLAREVGLSRSAFAERFTSFVGEPPMRYLALWRLRRAAQRLRESHAPLARIAFEVGYESEAAFSRAFKREFGVPPAAWRKRGGVGPLAALGSQVEG
jgi:AraC-like DNA-binding protein